MKLYPFYTALSTLYDLYGVELDEDTFENFAINAYRKIGNANIVPKVIQLHPQLDCDKNWVIQLPCDVFEVEAVTTQFEDVKTVDTINNHKLAYAQPIEEEIERSKHFKNNLYIPGKLVKYRQVGDKLYFSEPYGVLNILYKQQMQDSDGLPYLTESEVEAIATYCAYCWFYRQGLATKDGNTIKMAQLLKADWLKQCTQARMRPMSQNDLNDILDVMTSHDRHMYGRSTKPLR